MQHRSPQSLMRDPLLLGAAVAAGVIVVGVAAGGTVAGAAAGAGPSLLGVVAVAGATVVGAASGAVVGATEVGGPSMITPSMFCLYHEDRPSSVGGWLG